jgi:transposase-like protein
MHPENNEESQSIGIDLPRSLQGVVRPMTEAEVDAMHQRIHEKVNKYKQEVAQRRQQPWTMEEKLQELEDGFKAQTPQPVQEA